MVDNDFIVIDMKPDTTNKIINFDGIFHFSVDDYDLADKPLTVEKITVKEKEKDIDIDIEKDIEKDININIDIQKDIDIDIQKKEDINKQCSSLSENNVDNDLLKPPPEPTFAENYIGNIFIDEQLKQLELIKKSSKSDKNIKYVVDKQFSLINNDDILFNICNLVIDDILNLFS